jgi:hypothetical protein
VRPSGVPAPNIFDRHGIIRTGVLAPDRDSDGADARQAVPPAWLGVRGDVVVNYNALVNAPRRHVALPKYSRRRMNSWCARRAASLIRCDRCAITAISWARSSTVPSCGLLI